MERSHSFSVMQFATHELRGECLNVGLAILSEGQMEVRISRRLEKLRAVSNAIDIELLREAMVSLPELDAEVRKIGVRSNDERVSMLSQLGPVRFSKCGVFYAATQSAFEEEVGRLLASLVDPEVAPVSTRKKRSKLLTNLKSILRNEHVLARKGEDITSHRIVQNLHIAEGLDADLVLKNGSMHVIETIDASADEMPVRRVVSSIAIAALVLEQARMKFGIDNTKSRLVYSTSSATENASMPSLLAAENQGAELYNWASITDRKRLIDSLTALAVPYESDSVYSKSVFLHASAQSKLKLN